MTGAPLREPIPRIVLPAVILLLAALGILLPVSAESAAAAVVTIQLSTSAATPVGAMGMTNVARIARGGSDCTAPTTNALCATLFTPASTSLLPGGSGVSNSVTVTYTGGNATGDFRLYVTNYVPRTSRSTALCTAPALATDPDNPGAQIELQVLQGTKVIYPPTATGPLAYGTLQKFARTFADPSTGLALRGGTNGSGQLGRWTKGSSSSFTINLRLGAGATNMYQGCDSAFDLVWFASQ